MTKTTQLIIIAILLIANQSYGLSIVNPISYSQRSLITPPNSNQSTIGNTDTDLLVLKVQYDIKVDAVNPNGGLLSSDPETTHQELQNKKLISQPLFYPTPFHLREGSQLGYKLSGNYAIELRIYNMHGYELYQVSYPAGIPGKSSSSSYNTISIGPSELGTTLPSGIYFFVLLSDGQVIGKGKFALKP